MNLINNLWGGHCFGLSGTRCITGGKITTFKLGHPVFDKYFCQNGVNFLWCLALQQQQQQQQKLDDSSRLHVGIVRVT